LRRAWTSGLVILTLWNIVGLCGDAPSDQARELATGGGRGLFSSVQDPQPQPDALDKRAFLFNEVGEFEEEINLPLGAVPNHHVQSQILANEAGKVVLLTLAHFKLWGQTSANGGVTYGTPFPIETARPVLQFAAYRSEDERIYLAYRFAGVTKDVGLRFRRSDDNGVTWTSPVDLVVDGNPRHGVANIWSIHANELGRVAIAFSEWWEDNDTYVMTSSDFGQTWRSPVKPDLDTVTNRVPLECDAAVDQSGKVHVAYIQNRGAGQRVLYSRSVDGGLTFGGEQALGQSVSGPGTQAGVGIGITRTGHVVIAAGDTPSGGKLYVWHSGDGGGSFALVGNTGSLGAPFARSARVFPSYNTDTVIVGYLNDSGALYTQRSASEGASFALPVNRSAGANSNYSFGRTNDGVWVMAQERQATGSDPRFNKLQLAISTDDGVLFGAFDQADHNGGADSGETRLGSLETHNGLNGILVSYLDTRSQSSYETFVNRASSTAFDLNDEKTLGPYGDVDNRVQYPAPLILAPNATDVHLLYRMVDVTGFPDVFYARSVDSGATYLTPVRLSQHVAGSEEPLAIALAGHPTDGNRVYAMYARQNYALSRMQMVFRKSLDRGVTWSNEVVVDTLNVIRTLRLVVNQNDDLFAIWSLGTDVRMAISRDDGTTWGASFDFDQQNTGASVINDSPVICAGNSNVSVVWRSNNAGGSINQIVSRTSTDGGVNFGPGTNLRTATLTSANVPDVECNGGEVIAVWADFRDSTLTRTWSNRFNGLSWQGERIVASGLNASQFIPRVIYALGASGTQPLVIFTDNFDVYTVRSTDGGATWGTPQRVDDLAPQPLAFSRLPYLVADGTGNTWAVWADSGSGQPQIAARHSSDGGASWNQLIVRMNSEPNQGSKLTNWLNAVELPVAAKAGIMHTAYTGHRASQYWDTRAARWRIADGDGDGVLSGSDCNDADPNVRGAPTEVAGLAISKVGATVRIAWNSQDGTAGTGTNYDIVTGDLAALVGGGFAAATCLVDNDADTPFDDGSAPPAAGSGVYYLVRGQHACTGSYGNSGQTVDPRDGLDLIGPCP